MNFDNFLASIACIRKKQMTESFATLELMYLLEKQSNFKKLLIVKKLNLFDFIFYSSCIFSSVFLRATIDVAQNHFENQRIKTAVPEAEILVSYF